MVGWCLMWCGAELYGMNTKREPVKVEWTRASCGETDKGRSLVARVKKDCGSARHTTTTVKCKRQNQEKKAWRTLRKNTTDEQNIDRNCYHSSRPPTQRQASRLPLVKSVPPRMLRHHSDPQHLSHHDPHALPPNAHSRMGHQPKNIGLNLSITSAQLILFLNFFNVPRSVQRMKRRTIQDILLCLHESKLWSTVGLEHSVTCSTALARRIKAQPRSSIANLTHSLRAPETGTLSSVPLQPLACALCL